MHETAIVQGLIRILEQQAARHEVTTICRVNVKVGRLQAVEPRQLVACFELFAEGTVAEGAELAVEVIPIRARCRSCNKEFDVPRFHFLCPTCGDGAVDVVQGQELYIESFETSARARSADGSDLPVTN